MYLKSFKIIIISILLHSIVILDNSINIIISLYSHPYTSYLYTLYTEILKIKFEFSSN